MSQPPLQFTPQETGGEVYFDVETLRLSHEVEGAWKNIRAFGLAVALTWDAEKQFREWYEDDASALAEELGRFERIISFNGNRFDFEVLSAYAPVEGLRARSLDLLESLRRKLGFRVSLEKLAEETLGTTKSGSGLKAVEWWRNGEKKRVADYCRQDVQLLVDLVAFARQNGHVVADGKKIDVDWA